MDESVEDAKSENEEILLSSVVSDFDAGDKKILWIVGAMVAAYLFFGRG
jgi:hypothetical protein